MGTQRRAPRVGPVVVGAVATAVAAVTATALFRVTRPLSGREPAPDEVHYPEERIRRTPPDVGLRVVRDETRVVSDQGWRTVDIVQNVSDPTVTVIAPTDAPSADAAASRAAMIVLPGGGFGALAWDAEGIEVGEFLAQRGITAFVLKYRVRTPTAAVAWRFLTRGMKGGMTPARNAAVADAEQAVRFVRDNAERFGVDRARIGMTGFSAGAITTLGVLTGADPTSRPNIAVSVYGFDHNDGLRPADTPLLIASAHPDRTTRDAAAIQAVWELAGAPVELHVFDSGGHGFGLGRPGTDSARFAAIYAAWLERRGYTRAG